MPNQLKAVFFDIGDTLGTVNPATLTLTPFSDTVTLLTKVRDVIQLRIGVITTLGTLTEANAHQILQNAGLAAFLDPLGMVSEHTPGSPGVPKPDPAIYHFAAERFGLQPVECLFVGENLAEVIGAQTAGFQAVQRFRP